MAVVVAGYLSAGELDVLGGLAFIDLKVEVGLGLDLREDLASDALLLLALDLLVEAEGLELLLDEGVDAGLDLLEVGMVALLDGADLGEDALLLLGAAQLGQPLGLCRVLLLLLLQVCARGGLRVLVLEGVEGGGFHVLCDVGLHCLATKGSALAAGKEF